MATTTVNFTATIACRSDGPEFLKTEVELSGTGSAASATAQLDVPAGASPDAIRDLLTAKLQPTLSEAEGLIKADLRTVTKARVQCSSQVVLDPRWVAKYQRR